MRTILLISLIFLFYNVYSQTGDKISLVEYNINKLDSKASEIKAIVKIYTGCEFETWKSGAINIYLTSATDNNIIYPKNVIELQKDSVNKTVTSLLIFVTNNHNYYYLNYYDDFNVQQKKELVFSNISPEKTQEKKLKPLFDLFWWAKLLLSSNSAEAKSTYSAGVSFGLYPKLITIGKNNPINIFTGVSFNALFMLTNKNKIEEINSFYNLNENHYSLSNTNTPSKEFYFLGGGIIAEYNLNNFTPRIRIGAGANGIKFGHIKIFDKKNGVSTENVLVKSFGLEFETGIRMFNKIDISYTFSIFKPNNPQLEFLNKQHYIHTLSIGLGILSQIR